MIKFFVLARVYGWLQAVLMPSRFNQQPKPISQLEELWLIFPNSLNFTSGASEL